MAKSNSEHQADYRARKKASKKLRKEYFVTTEQHIAIKAMLEEFDGTLDSAMKVWPETFKEKSLCKTMKLKAPKQLMADE